MQTGQALPHMGDSHQDINILEEQKSKTNVTGLTAKVDHEQYLLLYMNSSGSNI